GKTATASINFFVQNSATLPPPPAASLSVKFTSPTAGVVVSGTVVFTVAITGGTAAVRVPLTIDNTPRPSQTESGATAILSVIPLLLSTSGLAFSALFRSGKTAIASINFFVQNSATLPPPPAASLSVKFTSPTAGIVVGGTVAFVAVV